MGNNISFDATRLTDKQWKVIQALSYIRYKSALAAMRHAKLSSWPKTPRGGIPVTRFIEYEKGTGKMRLNDLGEKFKREHIFSPPISVQLSVSFTYGD